MNDEIIETGLNRLIPSTAQSPEIPKMKKHGRRKSLIVNSAAPIKSAAQNELSKLEKLSTQLNKSPNELNSSTNRRCWRRFNRIMVDILNSITATIIVLLATVFALFNFDIKILFANHSAEPLFSVMNNIVFFLLTFEFVLLILFEHKYIGSFYFYLDLLAVISLIPDTDLIMHALSNEGRNGLVSTNHLVKASSASQAGARILTFIKIVRLAKIVETAKEIKINAVRKRSAIKDTNYLKNFIFAINRPVIANKQPVNKKPEDLSDVNKGRRYSGSADINFFKRKINSITKRRVSFVDMSNKKNLEIFEEQIKRKASKSPIEENLNDTGLNEVMNDENYVKCIISYHIDIFDPSEKTNERRKSEMLHLNFRNPVKSQLNQFLNKNAITVQELLQQKSLVVINDQKAGRHRSILVKGFANMLKGNKALLPAKTISKILKENEDLHKSRTNSFKNEKFNKEEDTNKTPKKNLFNLIKLKKRETEKNKAEELIMERKKKIKPNENPSLELNTVAEPSNSQSGLRSANDSSIKSNSVIEEDAGQKHQVVKCDDSILTTKFEIMTDNKEEKDNLINIPPPDKLKEPSTVNKPLDTREPTSLNFLTLLNDQLNTEASPGYVKISTQDKSNSNSFRTKEEVKLTITKQNEAFNIKKGSHLASRKSPQNLIEPISEVNTKLKSEDKLKEEKFEEKENLEEKLNSLMTKKLISLIMILLVLFPVLDADYIGSFIYTSDEVPSVQMYCLNSLDDAFTKALQDPVYTRVVDRIFTQCIDLAEDGSSLSKDHNISVKEFTSNVDTVLPLHASSNPDVNNTTNTTNKTNSIVALTDTHSNDTSGDPNLNNTNTTSSTSLDSEALSSVPPYFYSFDFTNYNTYHKLYNLVQNTSYSTFMPNLVYRHPDYHIITESNFVNYEYFIQDFSFDEATNSTIKFVYNNEAIQKLQSMLNIMKVLVVGLMLVLGSYVFIDLITFYVVRPFDKVMTRLLMNLKNTDSLGEEAQPQSFDKLDVKTAYKKALLVLGDQDEKKRSSSKDETYELDTKLRVLINLISVSIGKPILHAIADGHDQNSIKLNKNPLINNDTFLSLNLKHEGVKCQGVVLMIKFSNLDKFVSEFGVSANNLINKVYSVFHSQGLVCLGDISIGNDAIIWKEDKNKVSRQFLKYIAKLNDYNFNPKINKEKTKSENINNKSDDYSPSNSVSNKNSNNNSQVSEIKKEDFEFNRENIINLGFLCANKILHTLYHKIQKTMRTLKEYGVRVNLLLNYCELFHGYIGHDLKINEIYTSKQLMEGARILGQLNKTCSEPSLFLHHNFNQFLPLVLSNCIFPCEVVQVSSTQGLSRLVRIFKLFFNSSELLVEFQDTKLAIKQEDFFHKRKLHEKLLSSYSNRLEYFTLEEGDFEFFTLKNLPTSIIHKLPELYDQLQCNKLEECIVTIRKLKKAEEYDFFPDLNFKKKLDKLNEEITAKLSVKNKFYTKKLNNTLQI